MVETGSHFRPGEQMVRIHNNLPFIQYHSQLKQLIEYPTDNQEESKVGTSEKRRFYFHDCRNLLSPVRGAMCIPPNAGDFQAEELIEIQRIQTISSQLMDRMAKERTDCLSQNRTDTQAIKPFFESDLFKKYQKNSAFLNSPEMRKIASFIPTALDLNDAYMDMINFFVHPNEIYLNRLKEGSIRAVDILKKAPVKSELKDKRRVHGIDMTPTIAIANGEVEYKWEAGAEKVMLNKAEALILYSVINKFAYRDGSLAKVVLRDDGSIEFIANKGYEKNLRLDRYAEGMVREKPTRRQLTGEDADFSQGLYAAELLGYAIGKEMVYRVRKGGIVSFVIKPTKTI